MKALVDRISFISLFPMTAMMPLRETLKIKTTGEFWVELAANAAIALVGLLLLSVLMLLFAGAGKRTPEQREQERLARQTRRELGLVGVLKILLFFFAAIGCLSFAIEFLFRPATSPLHFGHYLVVGLTVGVLTSATSLALILFADRLADDAPRDLAATQQLRWLWRKPK